MEFEAQHLSVHGLSKNEEENALQKLLSTVGSSSGFDAHDEGIDSTIDPADGNDIVSPKQKDTQRKRKHSAVDQESKSSGIPLTITESRTQTGSKNSSTIKSIPPESRQSVAFRADESLDDAGALSVLTEFLHSKLIRPLKDALGVTSLTRIQKLSWKPMIDKTRDVLIRSETGSGKTLAYALPLLHNLLTDCDARPIQREIGTLLVVLCPTRELVVQVTEVFGVLTRCALFLTVGSVHGGENRHKEKARLRKGVPILITTPGRLLDHLKSTASFHVEAIQTIVLDEADRLLDMGFERAIRELMEILETKKNKESKGVEKDFHLKRVLVSATITAGVEKLSHFALRSNITRVGETEDVFSIPSSLRQHFAVVPTKHRLSTLVSFLRSQLDAGAERIIVFVSTADSAEFHYCLLSRLRSPYHLNRRKRNNTNDAARQHQTYKRNTTRRQIINANSHVYDPSKDIVDFDDEDDDDNDDNFGGLSDDKALVNANIFKLHGNMTQVDRAAVFHAFNQKSKEPNGSEKGVLFCTDVAARGLDMPHIDWIVHYDPPTDPTCYVHRIGRTARIGNVGDSLLFLMPHEEGYVSYLSNFIAKNTKTISSVDSNSTSHVMEERKYESFLFYLTKLDPSSNHMWIQSTATLERAISRLVMKKVVQDHSYQHEEDKRDEELMRLALFAYQSYVRSYAGHSKELKRMFFDSDALHLGHLAQSFGIDKKPSEVRMNLLNIIREDRKIAKETSLSTGSGGGSRKKLRVEVSNEDRYRSMIVQKQRKVTRDLYDKKIMEEPAQRALHLSEFDA